MRRLLLVLGIAVATAAPPFAAPLLAQQPDSAKGPKADSIRQKAIQDSIALMKELEGAAADSARPAAAAQAPTGGSAGPVNARLLPDISAVGDFVGDFSPKRSTQEDQSRLGIREVEVAVQAVVDPYLRGDIFLGISDLEGLSIEQAYLTTTSLPGVEIRGGRYLLPFGKQMTTHRHDLHTIEYPYVIQRFFGPEGARGTGLWLSRVFAPLGFYQELQLTVDDRIAERNADLVPTEPPNRRLGGLGFTARLRNYVDLTQASNLEVSFSGLTGRREQPLDEGYVALLPARGIDANAALARQSVVGADVTYRWRPLQQGLYKSFIVQAEVMRQMNERDPAIPGGGPVATAYAGPRRDFTGAYAFARWQLTRRSFVGARYDGVQDPDAAGRTTTAGSGYVEWFPSEFSKLVAAFERLDPGAGDAENRILVQASFALGPHKPHPF